MNQFHGNTEDKGEFNRPYLNQIMKEARKETSGPKGGVENDSLRDPRNLVGSRMGKGKDGANAKHSSGRQGSKRKI